MIELFTLKFWEKGVLEEKHVKKCKTRCKKGHFNKQLWLLSEYESCFQVNCPLLLTYSSQYQLYITDIYSKTQLLVAEMIASMVNDWFWFITFMRGEFSPERRMCDIYTSNKEASLSLCHFQHRGGVTACIQTHTDPHTHTHTHTPPLASCHSMQMWTKQKVYERIFLLNARPHFWGVEDLEGILNVCVCVCVCVCVRCLRWLTSQGERLHTVHSSVHTHSV